MKGKALMRLKKIVCVLLSTLIIATISLHSGQLVHAEGNVSEIFPDINAGQWYVPYI